MKVQIDTLVKRYKGKTALDGISLTVAEGEVFGFIGPNGAGKTTTMNILVGLVRADSGTCRIDGDRGGVSGDRGSCRRVGYLPEEPAFAEFLTGREYLAMIARTMRLPSAEAEICRLLELVSLTEAADRRVSGYSRGMRQRLGLACALLGDPSLLVLDEPSSALDPEGRKAVVDLILALKGDGRTVFLSTHILSDIERICDRIALIDQGRIRLEGSMSELLEMGMSDRIDIVLSHPPSSAEKLELSRLPFVASLEEGNGSSANAGTANGASVNGNAAADAAAFAVVLNTVNTDAARIALARKIGELSLPLVSLAPRKATLEELFLKKVVRHE